MLRLLAATGSDVSGGGVASRRARRGRVSDLVLSVVEQEVGCIGLETRRRQVT